jgi:hypothetical protein
MFNQYSVAVQKYLFEFLKERYSRNKNITERLSHHVITEQDMKEFASLITDIYEAGYLKATVQYKDTLEKLGYAVKIIPEKKE